MSNTQSSFWPMMSIFVYFYLVSVIGSENHCFNLILLPHFVPSSLDHRSLTTINNESTGLRLFSFWLFWPGHVRMITIWALIWWLSGLTTICCWWQGSCFPTDRQFSLHNSCTHILYTVQWRMYTTLYKMQNVHLLFLPWRKH